MTSLSFQTAVQKNEAYFPDMENAVHCSLIMHGFHNGKWLILCSK